MRQKTYIFWDIFKIHLFLLDFQGSKQSLAAPELPLCASTQVTEPEQTHRFPSRGWVSYHLLLVPVLWGIAPQGQFSTGAHPIGNLTPEADRPYSSFFTEGAAMAEALWPSSDFTSRQHTGEAIKLGAGWVHARWFPAFFPSQQLQEGADAQRRGTASSHRQQNEGSSPSFGGGDFHSYFLNVTSRRT